MRRARASRGSAVATDTDMTDDSGRRRALDDLVLFFGTAWRLYTRLVTVTGREPKPRQVSTLAGVVLLIIRRPLLWIMIPSACVAWLPASFWLRRRSVGLGQFLGWVDLNMVACLERTLLRPLFRDRLAWTPVRAMPDVKYRLDFGDLL
jgi:hypothetical protein